jgi:hypothetical protein
LQAEIMQRRTALLGFDRLVANRMLPLPAAARAVLGEVSAQDVLGADVLQWKQGMEALRADSQAVVELKLPAPVVPSRPVPFHAPGPLVRMTPMQRRKPGDDGDPRFVTEAGAS